MKHTMSCQCDYVEDVHPDQTEVGAVWRCSCCDRYSARVRAYDGRTAWVTIDGSNARFHRLADLPEDEEDEVGVVDLLDQAYAAGDRSNGDHSDRRRIVQDLALRLEVRKP